MTVVRGLGTLRVPRRGAIAICILTLGFLAFIVWIIYLANTGQRSVFFEWVRGAPYGDKIGHFMLFGLLTLGANLVLRSNALKVAKLRIPLGTVLVSLFALVEELSQFFVPRRTLDFSDLAADVAGIWAFTLVSVAIASRYRDSHSD